MTTLSHPPPAMIWGELERRGICIPAKTWLESYNAAAKKFEAETGMKILGKMESNDETS